MLTSAARTSAIKGEHTRTFLTRQQTISPRLLRAITTTIAFSAPIVASKLTLTQPSGGGDQQGVESGGHKGLGLQSSKERAIAFADGIVNGHRVLGDPP